MTFRTRTDVNDIVSCFNQFFEKGIMNKSKSNDTEIKVISMMDVVMLSLALESLPNNKFKKIVEKSIIYIEKGKEDKFINKVAKAENNVVYIECALRKIPDSPVKMTIDQFIELGVLDSVELKINHSITEELYRLLYSSHSAEIILKGLNHKLGTPCNINKGK